MPSPKRPFRKNASASHEKRRQIERLARALREAGRGKLARALSNTAKCKNAVKRLRGSVLGGGMKREKIYTAIFLEISRLPKGKRVREKDFFDALFERHVEIPMTAELFRDRQLMRDFPVPEKQRRLALRLLELQGKIADLALKVPFLEEIEAKKFVPVIEFARAGIAASMETEKGTPAFERNLKHYKEYLARLERERKALESLDAKGVRFKAKEMRFEAIEMLRALGERGLFDIMSAHDLLGLRSSLLDALLWEASKYFRYIDM